LLGLQKVFPETEAEGTIVNTLYISLYKINNSDFLTGEFITVPFMYVSGTVNQLQTLEL